MKKREFRNLSVTLLAAISAAASAVTTLPAHAGEGNGQGHNGPTLSPISVPGTDERGVQDIVAKKAIETCLVAGDTDRGVKSLMQKLGEEAFGIPARTGHHGDLAKASAGSDQEVEADFSEFPGASGGTTLEAKNVKLHFERLVGHPIGKVPATYHYEYTWDGYTLTYSDGEFTLFAKIGSANTTLRWPEGVFLPRIVFASKEERQTYDWLKNPVATEFYLKGLSLQMPDARQVTLVNSASARETALTADLDGYADCLKNEIQRGTAQ